MLYEVFIIHDRAKEILCYIQSMKQNRVETIHKKIKEPNKNISLSWILRIQNMYVYYYVKHVIEIIWIFISIQLNKYSRY